MKLAELARGDRFKIPPLFELSTTYTKLGEVPGTGGAKFYVENKMIGYVYMSDWDMEVIKVNE